MASPKRRVLAREFALGVAVSVTAALIIWFIGLDDPRHEPRHGTAQQAAHELEGKWQQFIWSAQGEGWKSGGVYRVSVEGEALTMSIVENWTSAPNFIRSTGLAHVAFYDEVWTFDSLLENGEQISFSLQQTDENTFEGYSYLNGVRNSPNRWLRLR